MLLRQAIRRSASLSFPAQELRKQRVAQCWQGPDWFGRWSGFLSQGELHGLKGFFFKACGRIEYSSS